MTHKTQVNIRIPNIESLYCINCKINPTDMQDPLVKSLFHSQILTCRLIIYTMRCCIASPSIQNADDLIHIVINKSFYDSGKFKEHLSKLKLYYTDPEPVHPKIYEACLKYTFTFRLAPHWNSIGKSYYLQDFNFLSFTSNINAIEWYILFRNSNDIKLELIPIKMNLFPLTLDSLSLPPKIMDGFTLNSNINSIDLTSFESLWVYVLPNLTKARIVSVSKILSERCPFRNYNELRRHWKNMYSYRLPKNEQGLLFYELVFPSQPTQYFTYPETCILCRMPEILMCDNKNEVASQFLKDLSDNVHSVCGEVIQVCRLYPELDIEYSCVFRKRSHFDENQSSHFQRNSFVKTPAELTMNPQFVNEKLNFSSLFPFQSMDKMKPDMQIHSQKVLSIMQNNKRKRKTVKEDENEHLTQSMFNCKKRKYGMSQKFIPSIPKVEHKKTVVGNLDDIISFYDIPSMYSKSKDLEQFNQDTPFKQIEDSKSANSMPQSYRPKPVIKNVENLCDMEDAVFPTNFDELEINKNETDMTNKNLLEENSYNTAPSTPKSMNSMEENYLPENLVSNHYRKKTYKSPSFDDKVYRKLQSTIQSIDLNDKILSELLPKETNDKTLDSMETQSYDNKIQLFLSSFDSANMQEHDDIHMKKRLYEEYKKSPVELNENNKLSNENLMKNTLKSVEKFRNNSEFDTSYDKSSAKLSPSLLISKKGRSNDVCYTYLGKMLRKNNKEYIETERDNLFKNDCNVRKGYEFNHQPVFGINSTDSKRVFELQSENHKRKLFETLQTSPTYNIFEESMNRKQPQKFGTPIVKKNLENKIENMQNLEFNEHGKTKNNEISCKEINRASFILGNPQNSCKTSNTSLESILETTGNLEIVNKFNNSPQYSIDKFQLLGDVQHTSRYKKDINEFADQSDFLSILSESSNESDTGDYESCKLVFKEALTLKK